MHRRRLFAEQEEQLCNIRQIGNLPEILTKLTSGEFLTSWGVCGGGRYTAWCLWLLIELSVLYNFTFPRVAVHCEGHSSGLLG